MVEEGLSTDTNVGSTLLLLLLFVAATVNVVDGRTLLTLAVATGAFVVVDLPWSASIISALCLSMMSCLCSSDLATRTIVRLGGNKATCEEVRMKLN